MRKVFAVFLMFVVLNSGAAALPVSNMQSAISGVIQQKAIKRGFAANDPRFGATLTSVSSVVGTVAGTAATIAVGAVTAPAWLSVLLAAGVGAVVTYGVTLGVDGLVKWLFNGSTIDVSSSSDSSAIAGVSVGKPMWQSPDGTGINIYGADGLAVARQAFYDQFPTAGVPSCSGSSTYVTCLKGGASKAAALGTVTPPSSCPGGTFYDSRSGCKPFTFPRPPDTSLPAQKPQDAVNALSQADLARKLNPELVAAAANLVWKNAAAQPGYDGLPYVAADPITTADVAQWSQANPDRYPTVADFVSPQPSANQPWKLPASPSASTQDSASPATGINPSTQPVLNLGVDPVIGVPGLEEAPTAQQILKPIVDVMPGFRNFAMPSHSGVCPKPDFEAFGQRFLMDQHCVLLEQNRSAFQAVMAVVWLLLAAFVVLRA